MIRNYKNYNIQQRKDGRYTVTITDHGHRTYFYGRTKKEVQQKLEVFVAELNNAAQLQYELNNPTKYMSLKNWAYICLNNYCIASIQGNTYIAYERLIRMHFGELGDMPIGRITNLMVQNHITKLSRLVDENGLSENYLTRLRTFMHMVFEYLQPIKLDHVPKNSKKDC